MCDQTQEKAFSTLQAEGEAEGELLRREVDVASRKLEQVHLVKDILLHLSKKTFCTSNIFTSCDHEIYT